MADKGTLFADPKKEDNVFLGVKKGDLKSPDQKAENQEIDWLTGSKKEVATAAKERKDDDADFEGTQGVEDPRSAYPDDKFYDPSDSSNQKKSRSVQIGELRKSRDDAISRIKELEEEVNKLRGSVPEKFDSVTKFIQDEFDGDPEALLSKWSESKKFREETEKQLEEKSKLIRELDISSSDEWRNEVIRPISEANDSIYVAIAGDFMHKGTDGSISVEHKSLFDPLIASIMDAQKGPKDALELRAILNEFSKTFKKATGEDFAIAGSQRDILSAITDANRVRQKAEKLYEDWESEKVSATDRIKREQKKNEAERLEAIQKDFKDGAIKAWEGLPEDYLSETSIDYSTIRKAFEESYDSAISAIKDPSKANPIEDVMLISAKGRMFDELLNKFNELKSDFDAIKSSQQSGLPGKVRPKLNRASQSRNKEVDWLTGKPKR